MGTDAGICIETECPAFSRHTPKSTENVNAQTCFNKSDACPQHLFFWWCQRDTTNVTDNTGFLSPQQMVRRLWRKLNCSLSPSWQQPSFLTARGQRDAPSARCATAGSCRVTFILTDTLTVTFTSGSSNFTLHLLSVRSSDLRSPSLSPPSTTKKKHSSRTLILEDAGRVRNRTKDLVKYACELCPSPSERRRSPLLMTRSTN